ncbi:winged helix-turn-helix transcriptional regulator [Kribbella solani]|uniref:winged helix-turn-helix transcriptional regulator n=2 Tax=Kribbella solani TaxID=236067 RepID=UPI0029AA8CE0|nr:helix-turn-helix domain-containing protein [Kribbella solani]MDX2974104.1 helix-turn-helix domain-containing protein [Kribbella solani]
MADDGVASGGDEGGAGWAEHSEQYGGAGWVADRGLEPEVAAEVGQRHQHRGQLVRVGFTGAADVGFTGAAHVGFTGAADGWRVRLSLVHGFSVAGLAESVKRTYPGEMSTVLDEQVPEAMNWSTENCTISRIMEILGDKWTFHVLRELFVGVRRFEDIRSRAGIPRQMLTERLAGLIERGLIRRHPYRLAGQRERSEYRLTTAGLDLYPVLVAMIQWGDQYLPLAAGPPIEPRHRGECGERVTVTMHCEAGHEPAPREVAMLPGPGAERRQ